MYSNIKKLTKARNTAATNNIVTDKMGKVRQGEEEIRNRWKDYVEELYDKKGRPGEEDMKVEKEEEVDPDGLGPELMEEEI